LPGKGRAAVPRADRGGDAAAGLLPHAPRGNPRVL
jgi:hypothetical protein